MQKIIHWISLRPQFIIPPMTMTKMQKRITFGSAMILVLVGFFILGHYLDTMVKEHGYKSTYCYFYGLPTMLILGALLVAGYLEFVAMIKKTGLPILKWTGLSLVVLFVIKNWLIYSFLYTLPISKPSLTQSIVEAVKLLASPFAIIATCFFVQMLRYRLDQPIRRVMTTVLGVGYIGLLGSNIIELRTFYGINLLAIFLATVKCTDIGAYFVGSAIGRKKLIPWLSPGKSWNGLWGGLVTAAIVAAVLGYFVPTRKIDYSIAYWICFGVIVGIVGQFGDLCESLLKRTAGVKDSGQLVPEFGGVLDMIDSPLMAAPIAILLFKIGEFLSKTH